MTKSAGQTANSGLLFGTIGGPLGPQNKRPGPRRKTGNRTNRITDWSDPA